MNGYDAQDMATQGADGFRNGYQAGYADAVKAIEAAQPAAAQDAVADVQTLRAVQAFIAGRFGEHDGWAKAVSRAADRAAAPVTAAPVVAYMVDGRTEQGLTFDNAGTVRPLGFVDGTPAAPGIDLAELQLIASDLSHSAKVDDYEPHQIAFIESIRDRLLALIDASHKGALNEQFGSAEGLDSPKGGSEARDAARYRWLREFAVNGSIGIPFHGWLNCDEPASEWDSAIDAAMQAGDAEVQP